MTMEAEALAFHWKRTGVVRTSLTKCRTKLTDTGKYDYSHTSGEFQKPSGQTEYALPILQESPTLLY